MKNTFAVTMTLLLALTLGGSILGFTKATHKEEAGAEAPASSAEGGSMTAEGGSTAPSGQSGTAPQAGASTSGSSATTAGAAATGQPGGAATGGETGQTPAQTATAAQTQGDASAGMELYASKGCAGCHAPDGAGNIGPRLIGVTNNWTEAQFLAVLREGQAPDRQLSTVMPRFSVQQITDSDAANIHAYLKTLN